VERERPSRLGIGACAGSGDSFPIPAEKRKQRLSTDTISFHGAPGSVGPPSVVVTRDAATARFSDGPTGLGRRSAPEMVPGSHIRR
jgi:hypothetical protein